MTRWAHRRSIGIQPDILPHRLRSTKYVEFGTGAFSGLMTSVTTNDDT
jgi:hypothetical protein